VQLEKVKSLLSRAKYGCASASNPISALQRDCDISNDTSYDDASVRAMYSDQLTQLENLIARQHTCQQQMREQLIAVEKQYHSVRFPLCFALGLALTVAKDHKLNELEYNKNKLDCNIFY